MLRYSEFSSFKIKGNSYFADAYFEYFVETIKIKEKKRKEKKGLLKQLSSNHADSTVLFDFSRFSKLHPVSAQS